VPAAATLCSSQDKKGKIEGEKGAFTEPGRFLPCTLGFLCEREGGEIFFLEVGQLVRLQGGRADLVNINDHEKRGMQILSRARASAQTHSNLRNGLPPKIRNPRGKGFTRHIVYGNSCPDGRKKGVFWLLPGISPHSPRSSHINLLLQDQEGKKPSSLNKEGEKKKFRRTAYFQIK